jgi:hypothetical protein
MQFSRQAGKTAIVRLYPQPVETFDAPRTLDESSP